MRSIFSLVIGALVSLAACAPRPAEENQPAAPTLDPAVAEQLWQHRNLGKAFYENPATQYEAIGELEKALALNDTACERANYGMALVRAGQDEAGIAELEKAQLQDPSLPHTWFNLGIAYKRASQYERAIHQFERMVELVPNEPISHFNLATLYKLEGRTEEALHHLERAAELDPNLAGAQFQLAAIYRQAGQADKAQAATARFRELKAQNEDAAVAEDLEWSFFAELCENLQPGNAASDTPPAPLAFETRPLDGDFASDPSASGLHVLDFGADGELEILAFTTEGTALYRADGSRLDAGLDALEDLVDVAPADVDNDGKSDLAVLTSRGAALYLERDGQYQRATDAGWPEGSFHDALWLDFDHDYDLDLVLLGKKSALIRNDGVPPGAGAPAWSEQTESFPFEDGEATAGVVLDVVPDTQGMDLAVLYADRPAEGRPAVLYRDRLAGHYEPTPLPAPADARQIIAFDVDHDGWTDLLTAGESGVTLLHNQPREAFLEQEFEARPLAADASGPLVFADLENRGLSDLVAGGEVYRNQARGSFEATDADLPPARALEAADFDADGRIDLAVLGQDGALQIVLNRTASAAQDERHWLSVALEGKKNPPLSPGAEIEVKTGLRYQKKIYHGVPLHFGLGAHAEVDTVRITWPNGLIQNEARQAADQLHRYPEAQRLSGSCPMIYTWNGEEFEFITDVLGVAPLGASAGDGETFPVDHDEYIQIAGESLVPRDDGKYEIRIVEELREVAYLDEIRLIAVDRPADVDVFINDKFKGPPFPEFRLFGTRERHPPTRAVDHRGRDVRAALLAKDRVYPDDFERNAAGVAEMHSLELEFEGTLTPKPPLPEGEGASGAGLSSPLPRGEGPGVRVPSRGEGLGVKAPLLVLSGWVDWADGSVFRATSQTPGGGLVLPVLEAWADGAWHVVDEDMGIPAGKPKTIVVDLEGKLPQGAERLRIQTNLAVYWDEIFLAADVFAAGENAEKIQATLTPLHPETADLRFAGFSEAVIHPERKQPEYFVYASRSPTSMWNPTPGLYTRYGDVRELLVEIDDRFVVMGSGDELGLVFDAAVLPELAPGERRDFLLLVDGWAKDGDANTLHSQTVGPLPFHGMPSYPYAAPHRYPQSQAHAQYLEEYNTRPALRLIRPLTSRPFTEGRAP